MSDEARLMTVGDLLHALKDCDPSLLVVLRIRPEGSDPDDFDVEPMDTFIATDAEFSVKGRRQTYLGDRDILRITFAEDEP